MKIKQIRDLVKTNILNYTKSDKWDFINYLDTGNLINNKILDIQRLNFYVDVIPSRAKRKAKKGDILYSTVRPNQRHFGYLTSDIENLLVSTGFAVLTPKNKETNFKFLYYFLTQNNIVDYLHSIAEGSVSTYPSIQTKDIEKIYINLPKLEFQNKIASILSAYDDLIEVNNKKIKTLNEMAQEIYKEWFVRFRFPGHEKVEFQNSILGSIPQDFKILKINDVLDDFIGGGWGEDDESSAFNTDAFVIRGTDFKNIENGILDSCPYRWHKASNFKSRQLKENDFILEISGGTAEQPVGRAIIVEKEILDRFDNKVICASFCKLLRIKNEKIAPFYFYYWLKYLYETKIIEQFQLQSTGIINFKFDYFLRKCNVLLPPKNILDNFEKIVKPIRDKIQKLGFENDKLIKQRDLLLPRLMSGKLEVKG